MQIGVNKHINREFKMHKKYLYVVAALITFTSALPAQAREFKHDNDNHKQFAEQDGYVQRHDRDERDDDSGRNRYTRRHNHHDERYEDARHYRADARDHRRYDDNDSHHHHRIYYPAPYLLDHLAVTLIFR